MGFLDSLRRIFSGGGGPPAPNVYWIYAQCRRCGEPLKSRINLWNDPSLHDDGVNFIVRKGLVGSGAQHCYQTVEVTLVFDPQRRKVLSSQVEGGKLITEAEYEALDSTA